MKKTVSLTLALILALSLCALPAAAEDAYEIADLVGEATDYADADNWISIPEITQPVDTFYIYPTAYMPADPDAPVICDVDDAGMRAIARNNFNTNEGAYSESTNVFAPYYRQTSVHALETLDTGGAEAVLRREPRTDIYAALDYYFENYNGGRPFILAGHSQGSMMTRIVLKDYMQAHPEYYERMVAAYPIGYSITRDDLDEYPHLRFAERADDTGVIISWNTEGPDNGDSRLVLPGAISINPINWKRDETYAPASENLGSFLNGEMVVPGVADAQVDSERGVVICTNTDYPYIDTSAIASTQVFGEKSFHGNDYTFYYANLRQNVADRVAAYLGTAADDSPVPRADVFRALYELDGSPMVVQMIAFPDTEGKDYASVATWAKGTGLAVGDEKGNFDGDRDITRAELAVVLYRYAQYKEIDVSVGEDTNILSYDDAFDLPEWSIPAFQWICGAGVFPARGSLLAPGDAATASEVEAGLGRFAAP